MPRRKQPLPQDPLFSSFLQDHSKVNALWGLTLRSQIARCRVIALIHPPLPDGFFLVLPSALTKERMFFVGGQGFPFLNDDVVQYIGEPLALLAGPDQEAVHAFSHRVRFVTRKLTAEENSQFANILPVRELTRGDDYCEEETFEIQGTYSTGSQDHGNYDPLEVYAQFIKDEILIETKTQWPSHVVHNVANAIGVSPEKVKVKAEVSSASLDAQVWFPSLVSAHAAILAQKTKQPIRMCYSKKEEFLFSPKRPESRAILRSLVNHQGRIVKFYAEFFLQVGAYNVFAQEMLDCALIGLLASYQMDFFHIKGFLEKSATLPRTIMSGLGEGLGLFALEAHVNDICLALQMNPAFWRKTYAIRKHPFFSLGDVFLEELIDRVVSITDYSRKYASFELLKNKKDELKDRTWPLRGIGLAMGFQGNVLASMAYPIYVEARLEAEEKLFLCIPLVTANSRLMLSWKELAAKSLQIDLKNVFICPLFSGGSPDAGPSCGSRALETVRYLIVSVCEGIAQKRFRQPLPITVRKVIRFLKGSTWDETSFSGQPFLLCPWGAAVAEVEISSLLAEIQLKKVTLLVDVGPRIDEPSVQDALLESVSVAIGWVCTEVLQWERLAIANDNFLRYQLPASDKLPEVDIHFLESQHSSKPRGLGTLGENIAAPAILAAVCQALGFNISSIPITRKYIDEILGSPL